jgi:hypothetical protein
LSENPGVHSDDVTSRAAMAQWERERVDPESAQNRENVVERAFADANKSNLLRDVECRQTLCRLELDPLAGSHADNGSKALAGKLGSSVAVVENDDERIVVLVPGDELE